MPKVIIKYETYGCTLPSSPVGLNGVCDDPHDAEYWCKDYRDEERTEEGIIIHHNCMFSSPIEHYICNSLRKFEYHEDEDYVRVGNREICTADIFFLSVDENVLIDYEEQS